MQSFTSFCGGLPAPDVVASTQGDEVPLGYKFSWSPRGVLSAALNEARFKLGGEVSELAYFTKVQVVDNSISQNIEIPSEELLRRYFPDVTVPEGAALRFEGIANRDSLPYVGTYGLGELSGLRTVVRGTLRCVVDVHPILDTKSAMQTSMLIPSVPDILGFQTSWTRSSLSAFSRLRLPQPTHRRPSLDGLTSRGLRCTTN